MSSITKDQLVFDPAETDNDNIGAFVRSSDGTLITHTTVGGTERLDTAAALFDGSGNAISSTGGALDVNIASSTNQGIYAEDSAHTTGDQGRFVLAVRNDAESSLVDTDGDYAPFQVSSSGRLKVDAEVTVNAGDAEFLKGTVAGDTDALIHVGAVRQDTLAGFTGVDDGDYTSLKVDSLGRLWTNSAIGGDVADDDADSGNPLKIGSRAVDGVLTAVSATNDRADAISDLYRRLYVNTSSAIGVNSSAAAVTDVSGQLLGSPLAGRRTVLIQNTGNRDVYIGGAAVSSTNGVLLRKRTNIELPLGEDVAIYAVCAAGQSSTLRLLETA